jgi:hypothetical protein
VGWGAVDVVIMRVHNWCGKGSQSMFGGYVRDAVQQLFVLPAISVHTLRAPGMQLGGQNRYKLPVVDGATTGMPQPLPLPKNDSVADEGAVAAARLQLAEVES